MTIAEFDHLSEEQKKVLLYKCCGASTWVEKMLQVFPIDDLVELLEEADEKWEECQKADWLEAFDHHPAIGDTTSLKEKYYATADWAQVEQEGASTASQELTNALADGNKLYKEKFGFIFIVFATGKSGDEMLSILNQRLKNNPDDEIKTAAAEQIRITKKRLEKLFL
ncbi:MAG: 2-oxo-4-hydroxy-4-carboxy-5-ureidoimidazoline decarboxylase [Ginsengibacter sp.]